MLRVFITGSSDGLGLMAARLLVEDGHQVTLHARNAARAEDARWADLQEQPLSCCADLTAVPLPSRSHRSLRGS